MCSLQFNQYQNPFVIFLEAVDVSVHQGMFLFICNLITIISLSVFRLVTFVKLFPFSPLLIYVHAWDYFLAGFIRKSHPPDDDSALS